MIETAAGVDVCGVVVGVTTVVKVVDVVTAAPSLAVPVRAKDQDRITALIEWIEVPARRDCRAFISDDDGFDLFSIAVGVRCIARSLLELGHLPTLDHFGSGSGGRCGVGGRDCDGQADGEGKGDNDSGETHCDDDDERGAGAGLYPEFRGMRSLESAAGSILIP